MNDSEFDDFLKAAGGDVPLPHSFKQGVWQRIESTARPSVSRYFTHHWAATFGVAAAVVVGLLLGSLSIPEAKDARTTYAESISPFGHSRGK